MNAYAYTTRSTNLITASLLLLSFDNLAWLGDFAKMEAAQGTREKALSDYRKKLSEHREVEARLKESKYDVTGVKNRLSHNLFIVLIRPLCRTFLSLSSTRPIFSFHESWRMRVE